MKKLIIAAAVLSLTGCKIVNTNYDQVKTVEMVTQKITVEASPDDIYNAVQQCVMDNVSLPMSGELFTFQSEKNNSLAFVYTGKSMGKGGWVNVPVTFKASVRFSGRSMELKPQNQMVYAPRTEYRAGGWYETTVYGKEVNAMVTRIKNCIPLYL